MKSIPINLMPFTLAHPAAVVPLRRYLRRFSVLSALVIGSITPDLHYFFPFQPDRVVTHSVAALLWYCLPWGLALYLVYHLVLKVPLIMLLPASIAGRLAVFCSPTLPKASWRAVIVSLMIGAITHLAWDSFTHGDGRVARAWPILKIAVFRIDDYSIPLYDLLQYVSAPLGMGLLAWWCWDWLRRAPIDGVRTSCQSSIPSRAMAWLSFVGLPGVFALFSITGPVSTDSHSFVAVLLSQVLPIALSGFGPSVIVYAIAWHICAFYERATSVGLSSERARQEGLQNADTWVRNNEAE